MTRGSAGSQAKFIDRSYFVGRRSVPSSKESYDERKAVELWESSLPMVSLKPQETIFRMVN
jgi:hypothetical protein